MEATSTNQKTETGILLIALGSTHYGKMAANLAASIRFKNKAIPIHLVYTKSAITHLTPKHLSLFTSREECPQRFMEKDGKTNYIKAKTHAYELSPYKGTLLLDCDLLTFGRKDIGALIESLKDLDFAAQVRGFIDFETGEKSDKYTWWCDPKEAKKEYDLDGKFYQLSSEVLWFRRCDKTRKLFQAAQKIFSAPKVKLNTSFAGGVPDELAFDIACCKMNFKPRADKDVFIYWTFMDGVKQSWTQIIDSYWGVSIGGNRITPVTLTRYDNMAKAHANALQLPYHYKVYPKRQWDNARKIL